MANELAELEQNEFSNIAQSLLPFATDTNLDLLGEIFGVPRLAQTTASVEIGDQNFEWYVRNGTFGSINGGQDIVIPAGVCIYTAAGSAGPVYIADAVTLPAAQSSMFFSATALYSGSAGNAASGIFSQSNFTNYVESSYGSLLVLASMNQDAIHSRRSPGRREHLMTGAKNVDSPACQSALKVITIVITEKEPWSN